MSLQTLCGHGLAAGGGCPCFHVKDIRQKMILVNGGRGRGLSAPAVSVLWAGDGGTVSMLSSVTCSSQVYIIPTNP